MDIIQLLPEHVANQIAAGEVIQRPASAVKELLENALDAGTTNIKLYVKDAGKTLLQVVDNGCGMSAKDALICFERHATSKINTAEDLFAIKSMGFRGEAMASMAAISHIQLKSKQEKQELGTHVVIEGGEVKKQENCTCANGTSIAIKNLFYNVPARRNFLKSDKVETKHIIEQFSRIALANPDVSFSMYLDEEEYLHLEKSNKRQRIVNVSGAKSNQKLVPVEEETTLIKLSGFVGKPEFCKRTRGEQYFFVNNRFIKSPYLHHAIKKAFEDLIPDNYFPSYYLYLEVMPNLIDINIHPTKTEIKFEDEKAIYAIIRSAVKHALGKYNVAPTIDFEQETSFSIPSKEKGKVYRQPQIKVDTNFNPFERENPTEIFSWGDVIQKDSELSQQKVVIEWEKDLTNKNFIQIANQFIVYNGENGICIIHQQRAHERILFEYFQKNEKTNSQQLAFPEKLEFSTSDFTIIQELQNNLEEIGFYFKVLDKSEIEVTAIPNDLTVKNLQSVFEEFLEQEKNEVSIESSSRKRIAKVLAKSIAIKTGKRLEKEEMRFIISNLIQCKTPSICPNGHKVIMNLDLQSILKQF
ncbi:MAG: DNA mismatch repair endonuclease MutL [Bacteroidota bacterium]|nr:DNA mismatch repair endonuclease MutL [Bacteroidota bacterium]